MPSYKMRPRSTLLRAGTATRLASSSPLQSNAQLASSLSTSTATSTPLLDQLGGLSGGTSTGSGTSTGGSSGSGVFTPNPDADLPSPENASPDLDALQEKLKALLAARESIKQVLAAKQYQLSSTPPMSQYVALRAQLMAEIQGLQQALAQVEQQIKAILAEIEDLQGGSSSGSTDKGMETIT